MKTKTTWMLLWATLTISTLAAQQKSTGIKTIGSMTIKIDLDQATSTVTMTMTGPSTKWITVGFGATTMSTNTPIDCLTYATAVLDQHLAGGHNHAVTDTTNNLTLVSNTVSGTIRTVVVTRPFSTGDTNDYTFTYAMTSINLIWAVGPNTSFTSEHSTKGATSATFSTVLGLDDITLKDQVEIYPNPSNGNFILENRTFAKIGTIKIYNTEAKMIREISVQTSDASIPLNMSGLSTGTYFLEISNTDDRIVKKIIIK